jgi:hypothetical protein
MKQLKVHTPFPLSRGDYTHSLPPLKSGKYVFNAGALK